MWSLVRTCVHSSYMEGGICMCGQYIQKMVCVHIHPTYLDGVHVQLYTHTHIIHIQDTHTITILQVGFIHICTPSSSMQDTHTYHPSDRTHMHISLSWEGTDTYILPHDLNCGGWYPHVFMCPMQWVCVSYMWRLCLTVMWRLSIVCMYPTWTVCVFYVEGAYILFDG